jgi:hypothetical protein
MADPFPQQNNVAETDYDSTIDESDSGAGSVLTKKYGPLPVWAWGLVVGGTLLAFIMLRGGKRPGPSSVSEPVDFGGSGGGGDSGDSSGDGFDTSMFDEQFANLLAGQGEILDILNQPPSPPADDTPPNDDPPPDNGGTQPNTNLDRWRSNLQTVLQDISRVGNSIAALKAAHPRMLGPIHRATLKRKQARYEALIARKQRLEAKIEGAS